MLKVTKKEILRKGDLLETNLTVKPPNFRMAVVPIRGTTPLVVHKFSEKAQEMIKSKQEQGSTTKKEKHRAPKDFQLNFENARHISTEGWDGIPANAFRKAMISACRTVGFAMTLAKLSVFVKADGYDRDGNPLVKIVKGEPHMDVRPVRNATGVVDMRARPMWLPGWEAKPIFRWDADQFTNSDIVNLVARVGAQVGLCEGRPDSKMSAGCGWGEFEVIAG